jgi:hypothetical protein
MAIEKPDYQIIIRENNFELRKYAPYITADVHVVAEDRLEAVNRGFNTLASYIFGNNISRQKISMTAPVTSARTPEKIAMTAPVTVSGSGKFTVSFTMPQSYSIDSLPIPVDPSVNFHEHPERQMAAIRFSGFFNEKNFSKHEVLLKEWLFSKGFTPTGLPVIAGYDPPFTPWFLKHNEVLIEYSE